jgi:hypothetical protein
VVLGIVTLSARTFAEPHTFTDSSGRTIVAEIMEATDSAVRVRRDDGRVFTIELTTLSEPDRAFVTTWRNKQAFAYGGITVTAHRVRLDSDLNQTKSTTQKSEDWCYKITITNESRAELAGLNLEYRLFYRDDRADAKGDRDKLPLLRKTGRHALAPLAAGTSTEVQTLTLTLKSIRPKSGQRGRGQTKRLVEDTLDGLWVRVLRDKEVLHEFATPTTLPKTEAW